MGVKYNYNQIKKSKSIEHRKSNERKIKPQKNDESIVFNCLTCSDGPRNQLKVAPRTITP